LRRLPTQEKISSEEKLGKRPTLINTLMSAVGKKKEKEGPVVKRGDQKPEKWIKVDEGLTPSLFLK